MKKIILSSLVLSLAFAITAKAQHSHEVTKTPPKLIYTKLLNSDNIKNQEVQMVLVTYAPGESSEPHRHPVETIGYVLEGEIESTFEGKTNRYKKGDVFYETPNGLHEGTKNLSKTKEAKILAFFIGDKGKPFIIPEKK